MKWSEARIGWSDLRECFYKSFSLLLGCTCLGLPTRNSRFLLEGFFWWWGLQGGAVWAHWCFLACQLLQYHPVPNNIKCKETQWIHCCVEPGFLKSLNCMFSSESFYVCFMYNIQGLGQYLLEKQGENALSLPCPEPVVLIWLLNFCRNKVYNSIIDLKCTTWQALINTDVF